VTIGANDVSDATIVVDHCQGTGLRFEAQTSRGANLFIELITEDKSVGWGDEKGCDGMGEVMRKR